MVKELFKKMGGDKGVAKYYETQEGERFLETGDDTKTVTDSDAIVQMRGFTTHNRGATFRSLVKQGEVLEDKLTDYKNIRRGEHSSRMFNMGKTGEKERLVALAQFGDDESGNTNPNRQYDIVMMKRELEMIEKGFIPFLGIELECYIDKSKEELQQKTTVKRRGEHQVGYKKTFGGIPLYVDEYLEEVSRRAVREGVPITKYHAEGGIMKHEFVVNHSSPIVAIENWRILRAIMKQVADEKGLYVSDSPAPINNQPGNGAHANYSVFTTSSEEALSRMGGAVQMARNLHPKDIRAQYKYTQEQLVDICKDNEFINIFAPEEIVTEEGVGYMKSDQANPLAIIILNELSNYSHAINAITTSTRGFRRLLDDPSKSSSGKIIGAATLLPSEADTTHSQRSYIFNMPNITDKRLARVEVRFPSSETTFELLTHALDNVVMKVIKKYRDTPYEELKRIKDEILKKRGDKHKDGKEGKLHLAPNFLNDIIKTTPNQFASNYTDLITKMHHDLVFNQDLLARLGKDSLTKEMFDHLEKICEEAPEHFKKSVDELKKIILDTQVYEYDHESAGNIIDEISRLLAYEPMKKNLELLKSSELFTPEVMRSIEDDMKTYFDMPNYVLGEGEFWRNATTSPPGSPQLLSR